MDREIMSQESILRDFLEEWSAGKGITVRTSGSTGPAKEILLPREQVERSARRTNSFFGINRKSRLHCAVSFNFIGGKMMIIRSLMAGCQLTFSEPSLAVNIEDGPAVSLMSVVPAQIPFILANPHKFNGVEKFLVGGSAIDDRLWDKIAMSHLDAWESYGMTETASHIAVRRIVGSSLNRPRFVPFRDIRLSLDGENCLCIEDRETKVITNDISRLFPDGSFVIVGRRDDVIITGGVKVLPQEIEAILAPYLQPLGTDFFISSAPDEVWTSKLVLLIVGDSDNLKHEVRHIVDSIPLDILPKKKRPKDILIIPELPLTPSGKLKRRLS